MIFFGAVGDGVDGGLADESGEASDAACGALVEVGGVAGEGAGFVVGEVEGVFEVGDQVGEGVVVAVAGGEGAAVDEGGAAGELGAADAVEQGCGGDVDAGVDERGADAFGEVFEEVGCLGAGGGAGVEAVDFVDFTDRRSSNTGSELRRFIDYMSVTLNHHSPSPLAPVIVERAARRASPGRR